MKKSVVCCLFLALGLSVLSAGDVATFVDKGFSEDGKYYVFGQYGKTDKKFQGWAELYQVDIAANDYTDNGVFKTKPSAVTNPFALADPADKKNSSLASSAFPFAFCTTSGSRTLYPSALINILMFSMNSSIADICDSFITVFL